MKVRDLRQVCDEFFVDASLTTSLDGFVLGAFPSIYDDYEISKIELERYPDGTADITVKINNPREL